MSTPIPVLAPPPAPILTQPYLTDAAFRAYPHWLDLDNLIPGGFQGLQDGELADVLLAASDACITLDEGRIMRLDGHYVQGEAHTVTLGQDGRANIRPRDVPLRGITAVSYGVSPAAMLADTLPNPTAWLTAGRTYGFLPGGLAGAGSLAPSFFGPAQRGVPGGRLFVSMSYVAGFPSAVLAEPCEAGDDHLTVSDPTSVLPGGPLALYDVGKSETVTVAADYVPSIPTIPPAPAAVPLAVNAVNDHEAGVLVTGMPRGILQAVICFAVAFLMREDVSEEEPVDPFGNARRSTAGERGGQAGGLINDALGYLHPYRPGWFP